MIKRREFIAGIAGAADNQVSTFAPDVFKEPLINLRIMAHCGFDSRATVWTGS